MTIKANDTVLTPNGKGTVQYFLYENAVLYPVVRHKIAEMTSKSHGWCMTPRAVYSGLWEYKPEDVEKL